MGSPKLLKSVMLNYSLCGKKDEGGILEPCYKRVANDITLKGGNMEKIVYAVWRDPSIDRETHNARLRGEVAEALSNSESVCAVQVNISDDAVEPAAAIRQVNTKPQMDSVIQIWVHSALDRFRTPLDEIVTKSVGRMAAYLVTESQPIPNTLHRPKPGQRTEGFSQVVFLKRPPRLRYEEWLFNWLRLHTDVGIDTQSNFEYVQNVVVRTLTYGAPQYDAMIEECFPVEAMTNSQAFYDAIGNEEKFQKNLATMMESCQRFIDFDKIDVVPTSQYVIKPLR